MCGTVTIIMRSSEVILHKSPCMSEPYNNLFFTTSCFHSAEMEVMLCLMALSSGLDLLGLFFSNGWQDCGSRFPDAHSSTDAVRNPFCYRGCNLNLHYTIFLRSEAVRFTLNHLRLTKGGIFERIVSIALISVTTRAASIVLIDGADGKCSLEVLSCLLD